MEEAGQAGWKSDPFGRHELRYWDGAAWTAHVSDAGVQGSDEPVPNDPTAAPPPPPLPSPAPAAGGGSWKDKLKATAQQAAQSGKELAEKGKAMAAEQQAARREALANDPNVVWMGEKKSAGTSAMGVSTVTYRVTRDKVYVDSGLLGTSSEQVPLWAVHDIDVRQNLMQRPKNVGDVVLHLEQFTYKGGAELVLDNVDDPYGVRDILNPLVGEARAKKQVLTQTQYVQHSGSMFGGGPSAPPAPAPGGAPPTDVADQLRKLAQLRDEGVLSEEEFAAQKQRLLGT